MGGPLIHLLNYLGSLTLLLQEVGRSLVHGRFCSQQWLKQLVEIGFRSQPIVILTGSFTGSVLAAQGLFQLTQMKMQTMGGALVSVGMLRELGPTITGLMLAGRVGASMAAEIGTMRVTEQVDALRSMGVHPVDYLVTPRFLAMAIATPLLIAESAFFGIAASYLVGTQMFEVPEAYWVARMNAHTEMADIVISMIKGFVFGMIIVLVSCQQGMSARNGAVGVGQGTTKAMVISSITILIANFFITLALNILFPIGITSPG